MSDSAVLGLAVGATAGLFGAIVLIIVGEKTKLTDKFLDWLERGNLSDDL